MDRLKGKVAIITGAAGGQGAAEARLFAAEGVQLILTDVNAEAGQAVASDIGSDAIFIRHDVSNEDDWRQVVETAVERFGRVDILVNNAGIYKPGGFKEVSRASLDLHYTVNAVGVFLGMQAVFQQMIAQKGGSIINVSSIAGTRGAVGSFAYAGSKWMVRGLSRSAAVELAGDGVRVNTIIPGLIDTPMLAENSAEQMAFLTSLVPAKQLGLAEDVANAALFLASDESRYIMGAELAVCGALSA
jgi:3alpha(or 20beta)-hydroxysteroid dehydrogenase